MDCVHRILEDPNCWHSIISSSLTLHERSFSEASYVVYQGFLKDFFLTSALVSECLLIHCSNGLPGHMNLNLIGESPMGWVWQKNLSSSIGNPVDISNCGSFPPNLAGAALVSIGQSTCDNIFMGFTITSQKLCCQRRLRLWFVQLGFW